jgi:hypothetical protein
VEDFARYFGESPDKHCARIVGNPETERGCVLVRAHFYGIPVRTNPLAADADFTVQDAQVFNFAKAPSTSTEPVLDLPMGLLLWAYRDAWSKKRSNPPDFRW